jgi:hypothetical protein
VKVKQQGWTVEEDGLATDDQRGVVARADGEMNDERATDARLWYPWLRINRVLRVMLHTRWSA